MEAVKLYRIEVSKGSVGKIVFPYIPGSLQALFLLSWAFQLGLYNCTWVCALPAQHLPGITLPRKIQILQLGGA